ncbi:hypothetical protein V1279_002927 [Bradyrhizobium sp. AZCC 1610]|uniref:hypothetical protein n=1 Tax=Bradyrhizobium sp. AZCC 1610 TaxID=3117020 RepID=UPI002FEEBD42
MTEVLRDELGEWIAQAKQFLPLFRDPIWAGTGEQNDREHLRDYANTLAKTRATFDLLPAETVMNFIVDEDDKVIAFTGNSPDAADRAKAIVGFIRAMPEIIHKLEEFRALVPDFGARIAELIEHNNDQLMENRAQREIIRQQKAQIDFLLSKVP